MLEVSIPAFSDLDTMTMEGEKQMSLRDMCFDL
jgi:hypothetical protein